MFSRSLCDVAGCSRHTVTGRTRCYLHLEDQETFLRQAIEQLRNEKTIKNLNISDCTLEDLDLTGKRFFACNFSRAHFRNVKFSGDTFRLTFLPFAEFQNCDFTETDLQSCVFAGSLLEFVSFKGSTLIHSNFNGIRCRKSDFSDSDLYFSRFIEAYFEYVDFVDCNLKKVDFSKSVRNNVSFKYSNHQEAIFDGGNAGS